MATNNTIEIISFKIDLGDIENALGKIKAKTTELKAENKELAKALQEAFASNNKQAIQELSKQIASNETQLKILGKEYQNYQKTLQNVEQKQQAAAGSYEELLREYELGQVQLKLMADTLVKNEKGELELSESYKTAAAELKKKKDALDAFNKGIGDNRNLVGSYADAIRDAFGNAGAFGKDIGLLGNGFKVAQQGAQLFTGGLKGIGAAFSTTGLPLLINAFQLLQGLIGKNNAATEAFQKILGALGGITNGIISVFIKAGQVLYGAFSEPQKLLQGFVDYIKGTVVQYVQGLANIVQGVFTLDFDTVKKGVGEVGGAYKNAVAPITDAAQATGEYAKKLVEWAERSAAVVERRDELEDKERAYQTTLEQSKLKVDDLIKQAKERTEDEQGRLALLEQAAQIERENLAIEEQLAKERLDIIKEENAIAEEQGQLTDDMRQKQVDAETEYTRIVGQSAIKQQDIENRKAQLIIQINRDLIAQKKGLLESEVALLDAQGKSTTAKRLEIAEQEYQDALLVAGKNEELIKTAENKFAAAKLTIRKEANEKYKAASEKRNADQLALEKELNDASLLLIQDATQRKIVALGFEAQERIRNIKATGDNEIKVREAIERDIADKLANIITEANDKTLQDRLQAIDKNAAETSKGLSRDLAAQEQAIQLALSKKQITEQEAFAKLQQIRASNAQSELDLITSTEAAKSVALTQNFEQNKTDLQQQLEQNKITQAAYNAELLELESAYQTAKAEQDAASKQALTEANATYQATITQQEIDANAKRLEEDKKLAEEKKKIQDLTFQTIQGGLAALSTLLALDDEKKKKNAGLLKTLAIAEVGINLYKEISGYWVGAGKDAGDKGAIVGGVAGTAAAIALTAAAVARSVKAISDINKTGKFAEGGFTGNGMFGADETGHRVAGIVHEGEWVSPKWMLQSPRVAPVIQQLESIRRSGRVSGFADGGFTSTFRQAQAASLMNENNIVEAFDGMLKKVTIVAAANEISDTQTITTQIVDNATI